MRLGSILACARLAPLLIAATEPNRLEPSSPWVVDYAENSCRLIRTFGQGETLTKLAFESPAPDEMDMLAIGKPLSTSEEKVEAKFLPFGDERFEGTVTRTVTNRDPAILWPHIRMSPRDLSAKLDRERDERERFPGVRPPAMSLAEQALRELQRHQFAAAVTSVGIRTRPDRVVILDTGTLGDAMAALDKCSRDSLRDWGVDPGLEDKIVRPVWAVNPTKWLFSGDYPRDMLNQGKESEVVVRLLIDASGRVTKCTSLSHFTEPEFNRISCDKITQRARFEPAELADGTRVPSYYTRRVLFRIAP